MTQGFSLCALCGLCGEFQSMTVAIIGGGSWGTALGWLLGEKGVEVRLWCRHPAHAAAIQAERVNARYLPELPLPPSLTATGDLVAALSGAEAVILAVPTQAVRETLRSIRDLLPAGAPLVIAAKGLDRGTGQRLSEVADAELSPEHASGLAALSGPNLAAEIVRKVPTATVIAARSEGTARGLQQLFGTPFFRVYTNADMVGVELGGALKNPIAVAAGISDGVGFGQNTKATLLTRGLAEMIRLGTAAGARTDTFSGLAGLGDLMATANSPLSRNYRLGLALGRGETLHEALGSLHQVAEGVPTTEAACRLAERLGVEVPIHRALRGILFEGQPIAEAVTGLLSRPPGGEA
jgi:glycerol-3-phosphate dehydrogenase (NAD(P)+)